MTAIKPTILVDSREQTPLDIQGYPVEVVGLPVGDYGIKGFSDWENPQFIIERKSLSDLIGSLTQGRERFLREVEKLREFRFAAIVIESYESEILRWDYESKATPQSIVQSLAAIQVRAGIHIIWAMNADGAVKTVESLARQFCRGIEKDHKRLLKACETTTTGKTGSDGTS